MCYSEQYVRLKRKVFNPRRKADVDFVLSVQSAAGSTLAVQQWKMLDPPSSGSPMARHSLHDWRPAVRTGMKWQRLAGVSL